MRNTGGRIIIFVVGFLFLAMSLEFLLYGHDVILSTFVPKGTFLSVVSVGDAVVHVYTAKTPEEQEKGLSVLDSLPTSEGMLFIFDHDASYGIWMKNMKFAIDIIWADAQGHIVGMTKSAAPASYPHVFYPDAPARYVLELSDNFIGTHNITQSDIIDFSGAL